DRNRSHWSTSKTPSYTKSVSWQHHLASETLEHATRTGHIAHDEYLIKSIYYNLFSGENPNKKP
ncbi:hypothetical protein RZP32_26125, partial [Enterobacter asburiae]|nr:hypothetical protein [Enterobacter asburiae]